MSKIKAPVLKTKSGWFPLSCLCRSLVVSIFLCEWSLCLSQADEPSVEQVIAVIDAAVAKINSAKITAQQTTVQIAPETLPPLPDLPPDVRAVLQQTHRGGTSQVSGIVSVWWKPGSFKFTFFDSSGEHSRQKILLPDQTFSFACPYLDTPQQNRARDYAVNISPPKRATIGVLHPRWTGIPFFSAKQPWSLADMLRDMIQNKVEFDLHQTSNGLLEITAKTEDVRYQYLCDPQLNYYAISCEEYAQRDGGKEVPLHVSKTEYQKDSAGVVYPSRIQVDSYIYFPGDIPSITKITTEVSSFELLELSDSEFTLESLNPPIGARIIDNRNGRDIAYFGVEAPSEAALDKLEWKASGPRPGIDWWFWGGVGLGAVGLGVGAWSWRKTRAA